eukprot:scaffold65722_cov55-Attheya_sp.AAC.1
MDDELEHLAKAEEVLRQELDSIHVVADSAVTSPRLSSARLLDEEIDEGGNKEDYESIEEDADDSSPIKEEERVDHDDRRKDKNNTMDFASILPVGNSIDSFSDDEEEVAELKSLLFPETLKREMDLAPPQPQDETGTGDRQLETPASADIVTFSDEEPAQNAVSQENTGAHSSETPLFPKRDVLRSQFSEHQLAELKSLLFPEEFRREMDTSPPRPQDEAVTGTRQSETPASSSGIDALSDEEEAQNCLSRENVQAEDGIFEPMKDTFCLTSRALDLPIHVNILKNAPGGNPLNVPVGTSLDVIAAHVLALFVSLITQSDFQATFDLINVKYDDSVLSLFEGETRIKWILSNICRFFVGVLSIAISFILIVQSTTVIKLFFNFAAVQFVSVLDNIAFQLAYRGYMVIGDLEQTTRKLIHHVKFRQRNMIAFPCTKRRIPVKWLRISIFSVHAVILYSAWSVVRYKQANGQYLHSICQSFEVNFGDKVSNLCTEDSCFFYNVTDPKNIPELPYGPFSGIYEVYRKSRRTFEWKGGRPVYYKHNIEIGDGSHPGTPGKKAHELF